MDMTERTLESREVYRGRILRVREDKVSLPNGKTGTREVVEHPGGVGILALDDDGCVVLVRRYSVAETGRKYKAFLPLQQDFRLEDGRHRLGIGERTVQALSHRPVKGYAEHVQELVEYQKERGHGAAGAVHAAVGDA